MSGATDFAVQEKTTKQVRYKRVRKVFLKVLLALLIIIAIITAATVIANAICLKIDVDRARSYQYAGCAQATELLFCIRAGLWQMAVHRSWQSI